MTILPLYQKRRGNFHGHFAFVSRTDMEISMAIFPLYHKLLLEISMAISHFIFVDGRQHILKKDIFRNILQNKANVWQKIPSISEKLQT